MDCQINMLASIGAGSTGDEGTEARVTRDEFEQLVRNTLKHREARPQL